MIHNLNLFGAVFRQYVIAIVANFSMLLLGMETGWVSPALVKLRYGGNQTVLSRPITEEEAAWIASLPAITGFFSIFFVGYLMDYFGRKWCFLVTILPRIALALFGLFATDVWMILTARLLYGIPQIISLSVVPIYASEIASKERRGALGTLSQILSAVGMLIMLSIGPFVSYLTMNIVYTSVYVITVIPQLFLPESPYFLYANGQRDDSLKLLTLLRGSEEEATEEIKEYEATVSDTMTRKNLLRDKIVMKTIGKSLFLAVGFQTIGFNAVTMYLQTIFESTKTHVSPEVSSLIIGLIQLLACICTIFTTDRFGRKPILVISLGGVAIGLIGLGWFFKIFEDNVEISGLLHYLPLVSLILVIFCFNAGMGSIMWMLIAELFDGPTRAIGVTSSVFITTICIFIVVKFFTVVIDSIGAAATYWIMSGNCVCVGLFVMACIPETKGKTILEIQQNLGRRLKMTG